ncbi:ester cyclase [Janthinobacterium sp.]|uniref:ester cyclase n=1 Tax=Janthinobacterium sp. TaxID=1871054 RepID=UPI00293D5F21|nr:ester cyclase [Janthinobacterium sp.]
MDKIEHLELHRAYVACFNVPDWSNLRNFSGNEITYNGHQIGWSGYRALLEKDFHEIPDLELKISASDF